MQYRYVPTADAHNGVAINGSTCIYLFNIDIDIEMHFAVCHKNSLKIQPRATDTVDTDTDAST